MLVFVIGICLANFSIATVSFSEEPTFTKEPSFLAGEELMYDISWAGLRVGRAVMSVTPGIQHDGREAVQLLSVAKSNRFISFFFPVKDRLESIIDSTLLIPYRISTNQRHGSRRRTKEVVFDQTNHIAFRTYKGKTTQYEIPPNVQDSLSSLYYLRTFSELKTGSSVFIDIHESKKNWKLELKILERKQLDTVLGKIPTIRIRAIVRFEGLLWDKGDFDFWVTEDDRHIPVKMSGKIVIGSIVATLAGVKPDQLVPNP